MAKVTDKIDESAFGDGRSAFNSGATLRTIVEIVQSSPEFSDAVEAKVFSFALGYADAFVDRIQRGVFRADVVVEHEDGTVSLLSQVDTVSGTVRIRLPNDTFRKTVA